MLKKRPERILAYLCLLLVTQLCTSQSTFTHKVREMENQFEKIESIQPFTLLDNESHFDLHIAEFAKEASVLSIDPSSISEILKKKPQLLKIDLPLHSNKTLELKLIKSEIFSDGFKVRLSSKVESLADLNVGVQYWGIVNDDERSMVTVSLNKSGVISMISINDETYNLVQTRDKSAYVLYDEKSVIQLPTHDCATAENLVINESEIDDQIQRNPSNCVNLYFETDYDLYSDIGSSQGVLDFLAGTFNQVAQLYANEAINVKLSEVLIWDTHDPYDGPTTLRYLFDFRDRLNGEYNGDLAHLVGLKGGGGVAYVNTLCDSYLGLGYSAVYSSFQNIPIYSWSVEVITHEIGHNLGSRHTHACVWNGNDTAIDGCGPAAGALSECSGPIPNKGTIMSYCHLVGGVGISFLEGFGIQPGEKIRTTVYNANCLTGCDGTSCDEYGNPCEDGDPCTNGETFDIYCDCVGGVSTDADNDGYCTNIDVDDTDACLPDPSFGNCDLEGCIDESMANFETDHDIWNDDGSDVSINNYSSYAFSGNNCARIRDNSGMKSSLYTESMALSGIQQVNVHFSFRPYSMESGEDFFLEISIDEGTTFLMIEDWVSGIDFENGVGYNSTIEIKDFAFNANTSFRFRCDASSNSDAIYLDDIRIEVCKDDDFECQWIGQPCDDLNACTEGELYDENCNCIGGQFMDSDNDGICDAADSCQGLNDNLIGTPCNDNDVCTQNDTYGNQCQCSGLYIDNDNDGYCVGEDINDTNPCIPDNSGPGCGSSSEDCFDFDFNNFENGWNIWNDGGSDATLTGSFSSYASSGSYCVRIRDNSGKASSLYTDNLDLTNYTSLDLQFSVYSVSMEPGEDIMLDISSDGGVTFETITHWVADEDFENEIRSDFMVHVAGYEFNETVVLRIRCDASSNEDQVYIDDVKMEVCGPENTLEEITIETEQEKNTKSLDANVYPNPVKIGHRMNIHFNKVIEKLNVSLLSISGQQIINTQFEESQYFDISMDHTLKEGNYILVLETPESSIVKKIFVSR